MKRILIPVFVLFLPHFLKAQTNIWSDSTMTSIRGNDCHGHIFEKTEELPSLKVSTQVFADSLSSYLARQDVGIKRQSVTFSFIVTVKSGLLDFHKFSGEVQNQNAFENAILHFADMWLPAKQNGRVVCSYVKLNLRSKKDKLNVSISQFY